MAGGQTERFRRVKAEDVTFADERLKDMSFAARVRRALLSLRLCSPAETVSEG